METFCNLHAELRGIPHASSFNNLALELDALAADRVLANLFPVLPPLPPEEEDVGEKMSEPQYQFHDGFQDGTQELLHCSAPPIPQFPADFSISGDISGERTTESKRGRGQSSGGESTGKTKAHSSSQRPSRWKKDQSRMGSLEHEAQLQQELADEAEAENRRLRLKNAAMEHVLAARERQLAILDAYRKLCGSGSPHQCTEEAQELQAAASASMTMLAEELRTFVDTASSLLLKISDREGKNLNCNDLLDELSPKVAEICKLMGQAFTLNPAMQFTMLTYRVDLASCTCPPDMSHWDKVTKELKLTAQQVDEIAATWELSNVSMAKTQAELMVARMQMGQAQASGRLRQLELQRMLSTAMQKEGQSYRTQCFTLYGRIFTPLQMARATVHSFPFFPNARALMQSILGVSTPQVMVPMIK